MTSLLKALDRTPPYLCYYLAKDGKGALAHPGPEEIARRSGLSERTVVRLSQKVSWKGVKTEVFDKFCDACGAKIVGEEITVAHDSKHNGLYQRTRYHLRVAHSQYMRTVALGLYKKQFRHLSIQQRRKFDKLCEEWCARNAG